jgi:maleate isomerase
VNERTFLGMLTPSSNTVLEPVCADMLRGLPSVSAHFARFRVTEISLGDEALGQFDPAPMLEAASLLADARVHAICWNGTSASWLGLDADRALCAAIAERTGVPATSSVLALAEIFRLTGVQCFGLVSPYLPDVQKRIVANFRGEGFDCVAEQHLAIRDNFAFSEVTADALTAMVRHCAEARPDAITILCTNLRGAPLVEELERELGIPIYDSIATALWGALRIAKVDPTPLRAWGRLFREVA